MTNSVIPSEVEGSRDGTLKVAPRDPSTSLRFAQDDYVRRCFAQDDRGRKRPLYLIASLSLFALTNAEAQKPVGTIPFQRDGQLILVQASIDNHPAVSFVVDSGADPLHSTFSVFDPTSFKYTGDGASIALGARRRQIVTLMLSQGMRLLAFGMALGILGALASSRIIRGLLFQVSPLDQLIYAAVTLIVMAGTAFACWLPAHRASRVDPMVALRYE